MTILDSFIEKCNGILVGRGDEDVVNAMEYLQFRGISEGTVKERNIGYCPADMNLPDEISHFGSELRDFESGDERRNLSFCIHDKLIVPVYDEFGYSVGFATRKPTFKKGETWWNLPAPFYKGKHLFSLDKSKDSIMKNNKIYLVEGYMDAICLYQEGLKEVVGIMGTSLSLRKIGLISRYCSNVCVCFDSDKNMAGQEAAYKAICQLYKLNFCENISVINTLPIGVDPDDYVKKNGIDAFIQHERVLSEEEIKVIYYEVEQSLIRKKEHAREKFKKEELPVLPTGSNDSDR